MPELPEVETVRRGLAPVMDGAVFARVEARRPDLRYPLPAGFVRRLKGVRVEKLDRRGKYLIAGLSTGESLIMHLGMSGTFTILADGGARAVASGQAQSADNKHDHVIFELEGRERARIAFNDPRRFGFMDIVPAGLLEECRHFKGMGPEPLSGDFSVERLNDALRRKTAPIKAALLDQRVIAGLGNIYACEALFRARISPRRTARTVAGARGGRLHRAVIDVLEDAIAAGGSTLKDFANADGGLGYFQHRFAVYDREGENCSRCGAPIQRIEQSGRSSYLCGRCQR